VIARCRATASEKAWRRSRTIRACARALRVRCRSAPLSTGSPTADPGMVVECVIDAQREAREHVTSDEIGALIEAAKGNRYGRPRRQNDPRGISERAPRGGALRLSLGPSDSTAAVLHAQRKDRRPGHPSGSARRASGAAPGQAVGSFCKRQCPHGNHGGKNASLRPLSVSPFPAVG
jgi:hypothetical protein